jgi:hypothetical protein
VPVGLHDIAAEIMMKKSTWCMATDLSLMEALQMYRFQVALLIEDCTQTWAIPPKIN